MKVNKRNSRFRGSHEKIVFIGKMLFTHWMISNNTQSQSLHKKIDKRTLMSISQEMRIDLLLKW